jgi:hypothetical protein
MTISVADRTAAIKRVLVRLSELSWDAEILDSGKRIWPTRRHWAQRAPS